MFATDADKVYVHNNNVLVKGVAKIKVCVKVVHHNSAVVQEAQLMLTNPCDAFRGQSKSPNMVPFDMLGMVSYISVL